MASYKVPQDVEADDKLIGPFSFRQFIYLLIVAGAIAIGYFLSRIFIGLVVIPLPFVLFFGALALPLRKDQPMETYLAAIVSFYLKPRRRLWDPDGQQSLIEIVAPRNVSGPQLKDFSANEAERRFSYLANIVDSQGWAVRGVSGAPSTPMNEEFYYEAQSAEDMLDTSTRTSHIIDDQLDQAAARHREELIARMHQPVPQPPIATQVAPQQVQQPSQPAVQQQPQQAPDPQLTFNPYPTSIQQKVIQPMGTVQQSAPTAPPQAPVENNTPSVKQVSPDIISLANNPDLSVETISREANRIKQKEGALAEDEVVISLH